MSRLSVGLVFALVVLAGCAGFGDDPADERAPYTVENPLESSLDAGDEAAWQDEAWIEDEFGVDDHERALEGRSHTIFARTTATFANGSLFAVSIERHEISADRTAAVSYEQHRGSWDEDGLTGEENRTTVRRWYDGTDAVERIEDANGTLETARSEWTPASVDGHEFIAAATAATDADLEWREDGGERYAFLVTYDPPADSAFRADDPFGLQVLVREDGLVRTWTAEGTQRAGEEPITVVREFRILDVDETEPERPRWADDAPSSD
ncbi:hypothetical protein [Natronobiforma cellulositropha]|uniref:hypothetical protein n=1 Tax=Natronobiforma cellulositropha TaxID=1679076 RepID=UPI0021D5BDC3|nr:hypothetical protein [Natronobiforma cellulositropha]